MISNKLTLDQLDVYLKQIFDLQTKLIDKDFRIAILELELSMEKQKLDVMKELNKK